MNSNEAQQPTVTAKGKPWTKSIMAALPGAVLGMMVGLLLSRTLGLGERRQQLNLMNTGSNPMLVKIDTKRLNGDGEIVIEPGKVGMFIYGEGDTLSMFPGSEATGKAHSVTLVRKPILAESNADDKDKITFGYKCE